MPITLNANEPAIVRGIKTVGVGKKGSKNLPEDLIEEILNDLRADKVSPAARGAFIAGLLSKGVEGPEIRLEHAFGAGSFKDPEKLIAVIAADAPIFVRWMCVHLLNGQTLDLQTAHDLGVFLFSKEPGDGARGLVASLLRVRYETDEEYEGLWAAMQDTIMPNFCQSTPPGEPIIQLAEPFNGNDHSYLITPLVAAHIQAQGYRVAHMVGRNSGPKLILNLWDVARQLQTAFAQSNQDLAKPKPSFGWFLDQKDISPALDRWVDIRLQTIKRPFLSTLEKFIKPLDARILVTSAFHPPYGEKMLTIAERAKYPGIMVIRNGIEGSMAFPLKRPTKILLSTVQKDGSYLRHELTFDAETDLQINLPTEEKREQLTIQENVRLITEYAAYGTSRDEWFDARVKATCQGFDQGLQWLNAHISA